MCIQYFEEAEDGDDGDVVMAKGGLDSGFHVQVIFSLGPVF